MSQERVRPVKSASSNWSASRASTFHAANVVVVPDARSRASRSVDGQRASQLRMNRSIPNSGVV
jgi:hypothetical protein